MRLAVGIDVGGTKIAGGLVDCDSGAILRARTVPTLPARDGGEVLADCVSLAGELAAGHDVGGVGLGVCELVAPDGHIWSEQTLRWRGLDLSGPLGRVAPATVASDVRAAALAEVRFGAAKGVDDVVYVTVGTGISFTLVVGGVPYAGARGGALTLGTVPLALGADALEDVSSGLALARLGGVAGARELLDLAEAGDGRAAAIASHGAHALGVGIAALVNLLDPGVVVIGGGLGSHAGYRAAVVAATRPAIWADEARELPIVPAALGPDAGVVGAALAAER